MQFLNLSDASDYLVTAKIEQTIEMGSSILHIGRSDADVRFCLINNCLGETVLVQSPI